MTSLTTPPSAVPANSFMTTPVSFPAPAAPVTTSSFFFCTGYLLDIFAAGHLREVRFYNFQFAQLLRRELGAPAFCVDIRGLLALLREAFEDGERIIVGELLRRLAALRHELIHKSGERSTQGIHQQRIARLHRFGHFVTDLL